MEEKNQVNEIHTVQMTAEQYAEFEQLKAERDAKAKAAKLQEDRKAYAELIDTTVHESVLKLCDVANFLAEKKQQVYADFTKVMDLKVELFGVKSDQRSHTFTNSDGTERITLGHHVTDAYRDTVNEGIDKVMNYLESLATEPKTKHLVDIVKKLLAKNAAGVPKASRVVQLRKLADEIGDAEFLDGVKIIEDSYQPQMSKQFIRAEIKGTQNEWVSIPLGVTEAGFAEQNKLEIKM